MSFALVYQFSLKERLSLTGWKGIKQTRKSGSLYIDCVNRRTGLPGGNSKWEPPDPIPNSEVKLLSADGSTGFPSARVGHCQAFIQSP